jgi:hypothetical protein
MMMMIPDITIYEKYANDDVQNEIVKIKTKL